MCTKYMITWSGQQEDDRCTEIMKMTEIQSREGTGVVITSKATSSEAEVMLIQLEVATWLTGSVQDRKRKRRICVCV